MHETWIVLKQLDRVCIALLRYCVSSLLLYERSEMDYLESRAQDPGKETGGVVEDILVDFDIFTGGFESQVREEWVVQYKGRHRRAVRHWCRAHRGLALKRLW